MGAEAALAGELGVGAEAALAGELGVGAEAALASDCCAATDGGSLGLLAETGLVGETVDGGSLGLLAETGLVGETVGLLLGLVVPERWMPGPLGAAGSSANAVAVMPPPTARALSTPVAIHALRFFMSTPIP